MTSTSVSRQSLSLLFAVLLGAVAGTAASQEDPAESELESLRQQVEQLSELAVRTQSHVMVDVEQHIANLWFAAQNAQWDLAAFYMREADSHLGWTVRIRPMRSVRGGGSVDLRPFQQAIKQSGFAALGAAIESRDISAFETAYTQTLAQCYACHQAAGLGYLHPHIPDRPPSPLMIEMK